MGLSDAQADNTFRHLEMEQQKELMRMRYETEMARQRAELARIDLEMKRDRERLRPMEERIQLLPLQQQHPALMDPLEPIHYDPRYLIVSQLVTPCVSSELSLCSGGFAIFWDFVLGLSETYSQVNLMTVTFSRSGRRSRHRGLPPAHCMAPLQYIPVPGHVAVMALKQSFPGLAVDVTVNLMVLFNS